MKRVMYILLAFLDIVSFAWGQTDFVGPPLIVVVDSEVRSVETGRNVTRTINKGEIVYGEMLLGKVGRSVWQRNPHFRDYVASISYRGEWYYILSNNLRPISGVYLPEAWISTASEQEKWVISYYLDVLRSQDRDTFLRYEKPWIDFYSERIKKTEAYEHGFQWYDGMAIKESLVINRAGIIMGGFESSSFFITNIIPFDIGYKITMTGDWPFAQFFESNGIPQLPFPRYSERQFFDMLFIPDGDYMDVYLDSFDNPFAIFAKVSNRVLDEVQMLIETNTCDLSGITWPRRADGNMDFPPTVNMSGFLASHKTTDRLRIRDNPTTTSLIVATLDLGTEIQVLETGDETTIDNIAAPWVRVLSSNGYVGWCFSGYLEAIDIPAVIENIEDHAGGQHEPVVVTQGRENGLPVSLLVAGGGALLLVAGVAMVVITGRKKR